ncbi:MAG: hypothetical protein AB7E81_17810 [Hyphomicrobiaceae bacterium]
MHPFLRSYAHTAWTPADPLQGLAAHERRAILLMPSTFGERLRMAPWRSYAKKRETMLRIVAERRLLYDLMQERMQQAKPSPAADEMLTPGDRVLAEWQARAMQVSPSAAMDAVAAYRMALQRDAIAALMDQRRQETLTDLARNPAARAERGIRDKRLQALQQIELQRARLHVKALEINAGLHDEPEREPPAVPAHDDDDRPRRRSRSM